MDFRQEFIEFAVARQVLRFGEFKTKAGRLSPYFFNAGLFNSGASISALGGFFARTLIDSGLGFDMLFGPAYKGITLAAAVSIELARLGHNKPFAYNRKEAKDHGEGGVLVDRYVDRQPYRVGPRLVDPSGERADRPHLLAMLEQVKAGGVDVVGSLIGGAAPGARPRPGR